MDRSTNKLPLIVILVVIIFLALNYVASNAPLSDWGPVLVLLLIMAGIWGYGRLSRGVADEDDSIEPIEPVTYERPILASAAPGAHYQQAEPNPADVIAPPEPVVSAPAVPIVDSAAASTESPVEFQPPPMPVQPRPDVDTAHAPVAAVDERAEAALTDTPDRDAIAEDKSEPAPPVPAAEQHPPAAAATATTIEEKSAPAPSASAAETDPAQAVHAPDGVSLPSVPVEDAAGRPATLSTPVEGSAPEPTATASPKATKRGKGSKQANDIDVSATPLANADPVAAPATLPINADPAKPDDLKVIEGIGPKMEKALNAAGISTFAQLSGASEADINAAIVAAGMRFAPSVPTWAEQASYAANGDFVGLETYQKSLSGGRKSK